MVKTFADFCAGIGAGRLGLEKNGLKCVAYSEIDKAAIHSYKHLFDTEGEFFCGDLTKVNCSQIPDFDIMIAGFPCQTFSVMGQRKGFEDDRGQIIYSLIDILKKKKVPYFILENVKGLVNHDNGKTIKVIVSALENAGYHVGYKVLSSLNYGVPQMRERVYFVGIRKDLAHKNKKYIWPIHQPTPDIKNYLIDYNNEVSKAQLFTLEKYLKNKYNNGCHTVEDLIKNELAIIDTRQSDLRVYIGKVPTLRKGRQGILYVRDGKLRNLTGYEGLLLQGFDKTYADKIKNAVSDSNLLEQVGNAMTVTIIQALSKALLNYISHENVSAVQMLAFTIGGF